MFSEILHLFKRNHLKIDKFRSMTNIVLQSFCRTKNVLRNPLRCIFLIEKPSFGSNHASLKKRAGKLKSEHPTPRVVMFQINIGGLGCVATGRRSRARRCSEPLVPNTSSTQTWPRSCWLQRAPSWLRRARATGSSSTQSRCS